MKLWGEGSYRVRWFLTIAAITVGVYLGFKYLLPLIFPFIVAYFLAWIIRPVTEMLYRRLKIPRIVGGSFSLILLLAVFGTALCMLVNILIKQAFAFIKNIPIYLNLIADKLDSICRHCDKFMGLDNGTMRSVVDDNILQTIDRVKTNVMPRLTERTISMTISFITFTGVILIVIVSAILIVKDLPGFHERYEKNEIYKDIHKVTVKLSEAGIAYLRSQLIIMSIVAGICILGLYLLKNEYAVLIGVGIAIMDALPILGSGMVYIPWAIITLINGNIYTAAILITIYLLCQIVREVLEPKLIGNRIGIKPLFTLIAMYIGVKLFSIAGFILGPIGLVIIITIYKVINEKAGEKAKTDDYTYDGE
jgi:sporulation integral membrane protein YtvI